ncbi:hypothetical protein BTHI11S_02235 [Bosea thiooxidans]
MVSTPQRPQEVRPERLRRRARCSRKRPGASSTVTMTPSSFGSTAMPRISSAPRTMPSVRLKPVTKSSRSEGLAIITA